MNSIYRIHERSKVKKAFEIFDASSHSMCDAIPRSERCMTSAVTPTALLRGSCVKSFTA